MHKHVQYTSIIEELKYLSTTELVLLILIALLFFRSCTGLFHFRLVWPEIGAYNEWLQVNNPINSTEVEGYQGKNSNY